MTLRLPTHLFILVLFLGIFGPRQVLLAEGRQDEAPADIALASGKGGTLGELFACYRSINGWTNDRLHKLTNDPAVMILDRAADKQALVKGMYVYTPQGVYYYAMPSAPTEPADRFSGYHGYNLEFSVPSGKLGKADISAKVSISEREKGDDGVSDILRGPIVFPGGSPRDLAESTFTKVSGKDSLDEKSVGILRQNMVASIQEWTKLMTGDSFKARPGDPDEVRALKKSGAGAQKASIARTIRELEPCAQSKDTGLSGAAKQAIADLQKTQSDGAVEDLGRRLGVQSPVDPLTGALFLDTHSSVLPPPPQPPFSSILGYPFPSRRPRLP